MIWHREPGHQQLQCWPKSPGTISTSASASAELVVLCQVIKTIFVSWEWVFGYSYWYIWPFHWNWDVSAWPQLTSPSQSVNAKKWWKMQICFCFLKHHSALNELTMIPPKFSRLQGSDKRISDNPLSENFSSSPPGWNACHFLNNLFLNVLYDSFTYLYKYSL